MGINPFGEESDSIHAWKERYKQLQFQAQTSQQQLGQVKAQLQDLQFKFEEINRQLSDREQELSQSKQELVEFKNMVKEREKQLQKMQSSQEESRVRRLENENLKLKEQLEHIQSSLIRTNTKETNNEAKVEDSFDSMLIPIMLRELDPLNAEYVNAFVDLVENVIRKGTTKAKIIAILIKYGGSGPMKKIEELVASSDFPFFLSNLEHEGKIIRLDDEIRLKSSSKLDKQTHQNDLMKVDTEGLFNFVLQSVQSDSDTEIIGNLETLRDVLQEREIPMTTIFFEIRKLVERIDRKKIARKEIYEQIESWMQKYQRTQDN